MKMCTTGIPLTDAAAISKLIQSRELSPVEVIENALERVEEVNPRLNLFVTITAELALDAARRVEQSLLRGEEVGPLAGVPITVKDNLNVRGVATTSGSRLLQSNVATDDSPAVARAKSAGACILGKTTLPEFATKGVGDSPLTGITRNPWDLSKTPGGSSAGGAAGVAAGICPIAIVTDGGGSTRLPASFCGVFGLKPQFGRVPYVPISATPSMSHVGIISNSVSDNVRMLKVIAGGDYRDPASIPGSYMPDFDGLALHRRRIAWSPNFGLATPDLEVVNAVESAVRILADELGVEVDVVDSPFDDTSEIWESEFLAGAGARLASLVDAHGDQMDPAVVSQIAKGRGQTLGQYFDKVAQRYTFRNQVNELFERYDLLITPTTPVTALQVGQNIPAGYVQRDEADVLGWVKYLEAFNVAGNPAATVPCGFDLAGMPIGMQIVGRAYEENTVLETARRFESVRPWASLRPSL